MNISKVADQSGLTAKTIRYYEGVGLVAAPPRKDNGYRDYSEIHLRELVFLRHARQFGFSLQECKQLLLLFRNPQRRSAEVHSLVMEKLASIEQRIDELQTMKDLLAVMVGQCPNDEEADCAIIDTLAGDAK